MSNPRKIRERMSCDHSGPWFQNTHEQMKTLRPPCPWSTLYTVQGVFFNWASPENVSRLPPPQICLDCPPLKFSKCWNHIHFPRHLDVFKSLGGGAVWDSGVFLKSVTYRPTLSKFREGPVKENTLYVPPNIVSKSHKKVKKKNDLHGP